MPLNRFLDADAIAARVPDDRDRYADLLRVASIGLVVFGHWMVAVVAVADGKLVVGQLIAIVPVTQAASWVFQVMPVFFFVGGFVNAGSWDRARRTGASWAMWVRHRVARLLTPLVPVLLLWLGATVVLDATPLDPAVISRAVETALLPAWFLVVYLLVVVAAPLTLAAHRRWGAGVPLLALTVAGVIQLLHTAGVPAVGFANYLLVWGAFSQLGFFWADGRLPSRPATLLSVSAVAVAVTFALIRFAGLPGSMVAVWGAERHNTEPPTLALATFAIAQLCLLLAVRDPVRRWLRRPAAYAPVVVAGRVILTIFVWHMTALIAAAGVAFVLGWLPSDVVIDAGWWSMRPVWVGLCALTLLGLVRLFGRFEGRAAPGSAADEPDAPVRTGIGALATVAGLAVVLTDGAYHPGRPLGIPLAAVSVLALGLTLLGVLGWGMAGARRAPE